MRAGPDQPSGFIGPLVGVELEYFVVDRRSGRPTDAYDTLTGLPGFGVHLKTEVCQEQLEIASPPFVTVGALKAWLVDTHLAVAQRLAEVDACLLPLALWDTAPLTMRHNATTRLLAAKFGPALAANAPLVAADQINVGAADEASAMRVLETLRRALPELMGLSVASPLRHGRPNGIACNRMDVVEATAAANPGIVGYPDRLDSLADHAAAVAALPIFQRPSAYYKWVRPMPHRGVAAEVRCLDKQPTLGLSLAFAALCLGLATAGEDGQGGVMGGAAGDEVALRRRFAEARRIGVVDAELAAAVLRRAGDGLVDGDRRLLTPLREMLSSGRSSAQSLLERVRGAGTTVAYAEVAAGFGADLTMVASAT